MSKNKVTISILGKVKPKNGNSEKHWCICFGFSHIQNNYVVNCHNLLLKIFTLTFLYFGKQFCLDSLNM